MQDETPTTQKSSASKADIFEEENFPSGELHLAGHGKLDPGLRNSSGRAQTWQGGANAIAAKSGFGDAHFGNGGAVA
jgi:hypothetical protein